MLEQFLSDLLLGKRKLLQPGTSNAKLSKNLTESYILNLAPHDLGSTGKSTCPFSTPGCREGCLNTSGLSRFKSVQKRRMFLSDLFFTYQKEFLTKLQQELQGYNSKAIIQGNRITIRLNGTSDLPFIDLIKKQTGVNVLEYSNLQFMDYTKSYKLWKQYWKSNYYLTFSHSEVNWDECEQVLTQRGNVAVVFHPHLPETYKGYTVISGDETDERYTDPQGVIVGLKYKKSIGVKLKTNDFIVKI